VNGDFRKRVLGPALIPISAFVFIGALVFAFSRILLAVPKWDFNWQLTYRLAEPKLLPKGTKLEVVAHYDNSKGNLFNPDPGKDVRWGDQTWEEMMIGFYTTLHEVSGAAPAPTSSDR